jgi:heme A synthase
MSAPPPSRWLHRLALATAGITFALVIAGGLVWATESALACPDWPLCHGEAFPQLTGRVLFEVGHRYIAGTVSVLTLALAIWMAWTLRGWRRGVGALAFGLVIAQALLGALTVWLKLPFLVRVAHLALSQAFFASVIWMVFATRTPTDRMLRPPASAPSRATLAPGTRSLAGLAAVTVYLQLLLGAFVRHTGAGLACNASVFYCNGNSLWPAAQDGFGALGPAQVVTLHKAFALCVSVLVFAAAWRVLRQPKERGLELPRRLALAACALVLVQIGLGVVSVLTFLGIAVVTAHLAVGSLLFVSVLSLYLALRELPASELVRAKAPAVESAADGAALGAH